jgi:hypothetical protein
MKVVSPSISPRNLSELVDLPANYLAVKTCYLDLTYLIRYPPLVIVEMNRVLAPSPYQLPLLLPMQLLNIPPGPIQKASKILTKTRQTLMH